VLHVVPADQWIFIRARFSSHARARRFRYLSSTSREIRCHLHVGRWGGWRRPSGITKSGFKPVV